jgi:hypothetical protein
MAVDRCTRALGRCALVALAAGMVAMPCHAELADPLGQAATQDKSLIQGARSLLLESTSLLESALQDTRRKVRRGSPDWLLRRSGSDLFDVDASPRAAGTTLVMQDDRPDGTDLLTVRYVLGRAGPIKTYAGAGINRTEYFDTTAEPGLAMMSRRNRHSALGAAAEVGAELRLSERLLLAADVRWADLHDGASALRSNYGPVTADSVMLGVTVGYRFR